MDVAELELELHRRGEAEYLAGFRFSLPNSDVETRFDQPVPAIVPLDLTALRAAAMEPELYGSLLSRQLFLNPESKTLSALGAAFTQARAIAGSAGIPLRLRLTIGADAPELHGLYWEMLVDPARMEAQTYSPLANDQNLLFSRYLTSSDWRAVRLKPRGELHALVIVANPLDLEHWGQAPIDVPGEIALARQGLGDIPVEVLPGEDRRASLDQISAALRSGPPVDIFYLVCHGAMKNGQPFLLLEDEAGKVDIVPGGKLVQCLYEMENRPRLVVLVSCQSAGKGEGIALSALGPQLVEIGVPAVLAMQDNLSMETAAHFLPVFFHELQRDGQIDRAMAAARGGVRDCLDFWVPVLFLRLKSGRLWYRPGFSDDQQGVEKFPALLRNINRGRCTPILGPGLVEPLLGSMREVASRWADTFLYPMAPHERESLPQVAQFLVVNQDAQFPFDDLERLLKKHILNTFSADLPAELRKTETPLNHLISAVGRVRRASNPLEPHRVLAGLPLPIYITANHDNLLEDALVEAGKQPQCILCPWNEFIEQEKNIFDLQGDYEPDPRRPLVFHLFGCWGQPDSVVLTEDHYFDFLIGITGNKALIPEQVRQSLADASLLFLGFQTNEWSFRVIFRSLIAQPGASRRGRYAHIAAQIEPEDGRILEPIRARRYLEQYFLKGASAHGDTSIDIYWGSPDEFMAEFGRHLIT